MNTYPSHAEQTLAARDQDGLLQRVARWLSRRSVPQRTQQPSLEAASWPECVGRPYVIGPGTLLVMSYMRTRLPALDSRASHPPTVPE